MFIPMPVEIGAESRLEGAVAGRVWARARAFRIIRRFFA
jgi:hypothetical protein